MTFLQPLLLYGLPLALLPIIIHLINQHRHRTIRWAAMMFLLDAKRLTKGMARLRQILILAMRVVAIATLLFAVSRPLASGWIGLAAGGESDSVLILLDRSASMEQQNLETGQSKRSTALRRIASLLEKTGRNSRITLIDSATLKPTEIQSPKALLDLPATSPSDTSADIPALLQSALDYIVNNQSGRSDVWIASDLQQSDWGASSGRWNTLRAGFSELESLRFYLLSYPDMVSDNLSVSVTNLKRRRAPDGLELVMDLLIQRSESAASEAPPIEVPVEFTINGTRTVETMEVAGDQLSLQGHRIGIGRAEDKGWGKIDLPADGNQEDNTWYFVFDQEPARKTVILSDDLPVSQALAAAAGVSPDPAQHCDAEILPVNRSSEIPWNECAQLFWQAPLPPADSAENALLLQYVDSGKTLVFLPPSHSSASEHEFLGFRWEDEDSAGGEKEVSWWRTDSGLLGNTQNGNPLPIGELKIFRNRLFSGDHQALLKIKNGDSVIGKLIHDKKGSVYLWGTTPSASQSSLASDGIAFFVMVHRGLSEGANYVANAQSRPASSDALPDATLWRALDESASQENRIDRNLHAGAFQTPDESQLIALNRPIEEDSLARLDSDQVKELFEGLAFQEIADEVGKESGLASEVWRVFLIIMALALLVEAALCIPPRPEPLQSPSQ